MPLPIVDLGARLWRMALQKPVTSVAIRVADIQRRASNSRRHRDIKLNAEMVFIWAFPAARYTSNLPRRPVPAALQALLVNDD